MILVNATYFKGLWQQEFQFTIPDTEFFVQPDQPVKVNMMFVRGVFSVIDVTTLDCQLVQIPFSGRHVSLIILLSQIQTWKTCSANARLT